MGVDALTWFSFPERNGGGTIYLLFHSRARYNKQADSISVVNDKSPISGGNNLENKWQEKLSGFTASGVRGGGKLAPVLVL